MDIYSYIIDNYQQEWMQIIRPYRHQYPLDQLGPNLQRLNDVHVARQDFFVKNKTNLTLRCSVFTPHKGQTYQQKNTSKMPCLIYLHSNSGNRLESLPIMQKIVQKGFCVCCFDFSGAGLSDGQYSSLGVNETSDLECVILTTIKYSIKILIFSNKHAFINILSESSQMLLHLQNGVINNLQIIQHLTNMNQFSHYHLWGRSMGAFTALNLILTRQLSVQIKSIVLDSPYYSIGRVVQDQINEKIPLPEFATRGFVGIIGQKIANIINQDIFNADLTDILKNPNKPLPPILIGYTKGDQVINNAQVNMIFDNYNGQKSLKQFEGTHNSSRTAEFLQSCIDFIVETSNSYHTVSNLSYHSEKPQLLVQTISTPKVSSQITVQNQQPVKFNDKSIEFDYRDSFVESSNQSNSFIQNDKMSRSFVVKDSKQNYPYYLQKPNKPSYSMSGSQFSNLLREQPEFNKNFQLNIKKQNENDFKVKHEIRVDTYNKRSPIRSNLSKIYNHSPLQEVNVHLNKKHQQNISVKDLNVSISRVEETESLHNQSFQRILKTQQSHGNLNNSRNIRNFY